MQVNKLSMLNILTDRYSVPAYQRPYQWDAEDNAEQMVRDIYESFADGDEEYFVGSIICIKKQNKPYEIVDGQQRLITLTMILHQMAEKITDPELKGEIMRKVMRRAIKADKSIVPTLIVRKKENDFYRDCILGDKTKDKPSHNELVFLNNKKRIKKCLDGYKLDESQLTEFSEYILEHVFAVFIEMDDVKSSFRLFNVLNNRGLPLSDADLVKNELLSMVGDIDEKYEKVEKKWTDIEDLVGENDLENFLSINQISEKKDRDRVKEKNFDYYDNLLKGKLFSGDSVAMVESLLESAEKYADVMNGDSGLGAKKHLLFLNSLDKPNEWMPAFIAFLMNKKGAMDIAKFPEFVQLFEKVYIQSFFIRESQSKRDAACYWAVEAINTGQPFSAITDRLRKLAKNKEFEDSLDTENFYDESRPMVIKFVKFVLFRLDSQRHDDSAFIDPDWKKITVEHILPQNMSDRYWTDRFSNEQHEEWLNKLGNLTILARGKNSAARNFNFNKKKEAYLQSNKEPFSITRELCDKYEEWNMENLKERHNRLKDEIIKLWKV